MRLEDACIVSDITPINLSIFYEDDKPYLNYTGKAKLSNGLSVKIDIPKMDLVLKNIEVTSNEERMEFGLDYYVRTKYSQQTYVGSEDVWMKITPLEREVTKEELEKELGYKIKFK